ncbi:MAG: hypothetical protein H5U01_07195, partial [Clostridia bacterium]|nr:hypothetical protein [Clostridia bacterium]
MVVDAPDRPFAVGGLKQVIFGIEAGQYYAVEATGQIRRCEAPWQIVLVRVTFTKKGQATHPAGWLVAGPFLTPSRTSPGSWRFRFADVLQADEGADGAIISLDVKWPQGAEVLWQSVTLRP